MSAQAGSAPDQTAALERGEIVTVPAPVFELTASERRFLSPSWLEGHSKNISFNPKTRVLRGTSARGANLQDLQSALERFSAAARDVLHALCPGYGDALQFGLTSYRPAEIAGRATSWRKDDTRLHVDTFPSRPTGGRRILRLFVNAGSAPRHWRTGEPFEQVAQRFAPKLRPPTPGTNWLRLRFGLTKGPRTLYDHFMLGIHDAMKGDSAYQAELPKTDIYFPPGAVWICYTDAVSHAALSGQFAFEQTFYLPVNAMQDPELAPLRILERLLRRRLAAPHQ